MKNIWRLTFIYIISFNLLASTSPDFPHFKSTSTDLHSGEKIEFETILVDQTISDEKIVEWSYKNLSEAEKSTIQIILSEDEIINKEIELLLLKIKFKIEHRTTPFKNALKEYRVKIDDEVRKLAGNSKKYFEKHERISLSLLRTVVNGSTVSAGLIINGGLAPEVGLAIGFFSGSLSGFFQYFNSQFQKLIDGNHVRNEELISTKKHGQTIVKTMQMSKWFAIEVSLYALIDGFTMALGVPIGDLSTEAMKVVRSSAMATGSQGLWDSTIATETRNALRDAEGNPTEQARIQMKSNVKTFAVSMASVFGGVMSLMGANIGSWSLGILGATGVVYTYFSWKKNRPKELIISPSLVVDCRKVFAL